MMATPFGKTMDPDKINLANINKTCLGRFQDCGRGKGKNM
jgi:hypothetical protein